ncbi:hypothetical protein ACSETL_35435, partial [Pseudomonas aeruginosa]
GISGRIRVEWVAGSPWNRWSDAYGMGGQMTVESAVLENPKEGEVVEGNLERGKRRSEAPYGVSLPVQDQIDSLQMERVAFMAHGRFSNQQCDTVRSAARDAARIRERADKLARGIKEVFDGDYPKRNGESHSSLPRKVSSRSIRRMARDVAN